MNYQIKTAKNYQLKTDCLVVAVKQLKKLSGQLPELNRLTGKSIDRLQESKLFSGIKGEIVVLPVPAGIAANNILFVGVGAEKSLPADAVREILNAVAKRIKTQDFQSATFDLAGLIDKSDIGTVSRHCLEAIGDSQHQIIKNPKAAKDKMPAVNFRCTLWCDDRAQSAAAGKGAAIGMAMDNGKSLAKDLGNLPGNVCTPSYLAKQAKTLAKSHKLKVKVLEEKDMAALKMGSLLSVSKGSRQPAKLIIMEYFGAKNLKEAPHLMVGKGLTFDAGGISLKPGAKMDEMKYDMCGGASVFGTMLAVAELELPINVVGIVPSSENLPDGIATKPGDVVTSMAGITIEVLNTDAEGRLILCDALTYSKRYKPKTVIDIATLTGAVIVALGHQTAGLMGNDQPLVDALLAAGETSLDTAWQLPLKDTYKKQLKSDYADLANIGGPSAGSITAGCFLSCFTEDLRWAHLDIAGTAWGGAAGKRASGRAVPILTQYMIDQC